MVWEDQGIGCENWAEINILIIRGEFQGGLYWRSLASVSDLVE